MSYCTVTEVTDLLEAVEDYSATTWTSAKILTLIDNCATYFEDTLCKGKKFSSTSYTETYDGNGKHDMRLNHTPIIAIQSLSIDETVIASTDIYVYATRIACTYRYNLGRQNISVTYTAGKTTVPKPVADAIAKLAASHIARVAGTGTSESISIAAGPIKLAESFSPAGKYADKITNWDKDIRRIARQYGGGVRLISETNNKRDEFVEFDPRSDRYVI